MFRKGVNEFRKDESRSESQMKMTTPEVIRKIHNVVLSHRRIKVYEIVEAIGVSQETMFSVLGENLNV